MLGNVGGPQLLVILLVALIVLGPDKLPEAARSVGKMFRQVRAVSSGFQQEMREAMDAMDVSDTPSSSTPANRTKTNGTNGSSTGRNLHPGLGKGPALPPAPPAPAALPESTGGVPTEGTWQTDGPDHSFS
ncbi:MAG: twin-arginine translocase subunit TatB [Acidimicrobiia bacterium]|nr:twin-arginine translocase subunit TatB [Acidimicrobiia bacterium]